MGQARTRTAVRGATHPPIDQTHCSQCGQPFESSACGPTHALIAHERASIPHTRDEHCAPHIDPSTGCCRVCGVERAEEPCERCGGRSFHTDECAGATITIAQANTLPREMAELLVEIESRAFMSAYGTWTLPHTPIDVLEQVRKVIATAREVGLLAKGGEVDRG